LPVTVIASDTGNRLKNMHEGILTFARAGSGDRDWLYDLHKQTLKPYAELVYGWDKTQQREMFVARFSKGTDYLILLGDTRAGMVSYAEDAEDIRILRIEILPELQRQGIGTAVVGRIIDMAREAAKSVSLRVLRVNPARRLYERLGFRVTSETETHYYLKLSWPRGADGL
jgi:ribosomal protein S18 acetylase RimI-like enzyme